MLSFNGLATCSGCSYDLPGIPGGMIHLAESTADESGIRVLCRETVTPGVQYRRKLPRAAAAGLPQGQTQAVGMGPLFVLAAPCPAGCQGCGWFSGGYFEHDRHQGIERCVAKCKPTVRPLESLLSPPAFDSHGRAAVLKAKDQRRAGPRRGDHGIAGNSNPCHGERADSHAVAEGILQRYEPC